jgi:hypothetical protein
MAAEIALIDIIRDDATLAATLGAGTSARVYPITRTQSSAIPAVVVRSQDVAPSDTKDGASTLDSEYVQVLMYGSDIGVLINTIEARMRIILDRITPGTYNGVVIQSSQFQDRDTWDEQIDNRELYVIEHIYKVRVKR